MKDDSRRLNLLEHIDKALVVIAACVMVAVMLIVTADVAMRYFFIRPIAWAYDVIGLYLMATIFFLALPYSLGQHSHISVDVVVHQIPRRLRHAIEALGYAAISVIFGLLVWLTADRLGVAFINSEIVDGAVSLPAWIAQVPVLIGTVVLAIHCLIRCALHTASILSENSFIEFAPQSGTQETATPETAS